jgi:hypothetical protein
MRERSTKQEQEQATADALAARNPLPKLLTGTISDYDQRMSEACIEYDAWQEQVAAGKARGRGWSRDESASIVTPVSDKELQRFGIGF